ncbi:MAG: PEGA domain-containing protein [Candidatus Rokubacteria bacterium]|nr:PEGA domain-containing protein [Candidatus Rokubacteria bacterium]
MMSPRQCAVVAVLALGASLLAQAEAQVVPFYAPAPGALSTYVLVPHGSGFVYVPLDAWGNPLNLPGVLPGMPAPAVPGVPPVPATPSAPSGVDLGYLRIDVEPREAEIYVDGQRAGRAGQFAGLQGFLSLAPGTHRVDITFPGFLPLTTEVQIAPRQTYAIRGQLARDTNAPAPAPGGGGYYVVPPAGQTPTPAPQGSGYHVVPKP